MRLKCHFDFDNYKNTLELDDDEQKQITIGRLFPVVIEDSKVSRSQVLLYYDDEDGLFKAKCLGGNYCVINDEPLKKNESRIIQSDDTLFLINGFYAIKLELCNDEDEEKRETDVESSEDVSDEQSNISSESDYIGGMIRKSSKVIAAKQVPKYWKKTAFANFKKRKISEIEPDEGNAKKIKEKWENMEEEERKLFYFEE